jgi:putative ABC transport system permease protein
MIFARIKRRFLALFRKDQLERELNDELRFHLERDIDENVQRGMSATDARYAALKSFGAMEKAREECRDARGTRIIEETWQDLRYGARALLKQPSFSAIAILTLGLGIGATTAIFGIVNAVLLRPFPYHAPERLVMLQERVSNTPPGSGFSPSYSNFVDWRVQNTAFASMAAVRMDENFNLTGAGQPERLRGRLVSADFFSTVGIKPLVGRDFLGEEDREGATPAVILSYGFWQRRFGADPNIVGKQLTLNNQSFTVVGITPPNFQFGAEADVTIPIGLQAERFRLRGRDPGTDVVARLKPYVSEQQAETELNLIAARLEQQYPESNKARRVLVTPLHEYFVGDVQQPLVILLGSVGLVLLIACANVANLLLVRASTREREMAMRVALGAGRWRIVRQLLTESVLLATFGSVLGILLALCGTGFIVSQLPDSIPRLQSAKIDAPVLVFALAVSLLTGLLFGLAPALQASRQCLTALKQGERGSSGLGKRLRSAFVVGEVALTLTLLVGAGLLIQSFRRVLAVDPGFKAQNLLTLQLSVNNADGEQVANFLEQLQQNVRNLPGVKSVALSNGLPFAGANHPAFLIEGRPIPDKKPNGQHYTISPDYFQTMGIGLLRGRVFAAQDTRDSQAVAIINEVLAKRYFPNEDPLGKRLKQSPDTPSLQIVGVVQRVEPYGLDRQASGVAQFYTNFNQIDLHELPNYVVEINLLVRTDVEPSSLASAVRAQVAALNKDQPVFNVRSMEEILGQSLAPRRFSMLLLAVFAVAALALASLGIYGLMSYAVAQRTREIGVRMALGARSGDVLRLVMGQGMKLALAGVALGLVASVALTRTIKSLLFGVSTIDPVTFAALPLLVMLIGMLACCIPARRATRVDPLIALKYE